jgi:putative hydrolase of the HAD superfamily
MNFKNKIFVFDLDDTLYSEKDFETSGIKYICDTLMISKNHIDNILSNRDNWIQKINSIINNKISIEQLLVLYRNHVPNIKLYGHANKLLNTLLINNVEMSLISDGRSITQRNKLKALNIDKYFKHIIISEEINSEKPSEANFKKVINQLGNQNYIYLADNVSKDFITPNKLGWTTICLLDKGYNVHSQNFKISKEYLPQIIVNSFDEIKIN